MNFIVPLLCLFVLFFVSFEVNGAAVIGMDFGSEFVKSVLVKPGKPFTIVEDETSKRKFPAVIAFDADHRIFGNAATSFTAKNPHLSFSLLRDLLGKRFGCEAMLKLQEQHFPYKFVPISDRNTIGIEVDLIGKGPKVFSIEELVGMILRYAKNLATGTANEKGLPETIVKDAVITIPSFYTSHQRAAVLDAAKIAGLNVLSLLDDNTAAAIQFGIDRSYENTSSIVCFYNMGSTSTSASVVQYSSYAKSITKKTNKTVSQLEVLGTGFSENLGGRFFDGVIVDRLAEEFQAFLETKGESIKVLEHPRIMARLMQSARKVKEVLSANKDYPIYVESLYGDFDFTYTLSRDDFMEMSHNLLERTTESIANALQQSGVSIGDIDTFVLIGGGMRIPKVQSILKEYTKHDELNQNLNADEAIAFGASLRAANQSLAFRVRNFGMTDRFSYPIGIRIHNLGPEQKDDWSKRASLFAPSAVKGQKKRKSISFEHTSDVTVQVFHEDFDAIPVPSSFEKEIKEFNITGVESAFEKIKQKNGNILDDPKISLSFQLTDDGILDLSAAKLICNVEYTEMKKVKKEVVTVKPVVESSPEEESEDSPEEESEESPEKPEESPETPEYEEKIITRKKKEQMSLSVSVGPSRDPNAVRFMNKDDFDRASNLLEEFDEADIYSMRLAYASNELESFIYSSRSKLNYEDEILAVTIEEQRESILEMLEAAENWLYENEEPESPEKYEKKLAELRESFDPIVLRSKEHIERPKTIDMVHKYMAEINSTLSGKLEWLPEEDKAGLFEKMLKLSTWLDERVKEQETKLVHENPVFTSSEILQNLEKVHSTFSKLSKKRKPKPAPKPVEMDSNSSADSNSSESSNSSSDSFPEPDEHVTPDIEADSSVKDEL